MDRMTVGSLFSGIGGCCLGFQRAGFEIKWTVEIDPYCRTVLARNFPNAERFDDVKQVGKHNLTTVDILTGGFPCQDISVAGPGLGLAGSRSGLWFEFSRIIGELRPKYVLVENVAAVLGRGLSTVLGCLSEIGYDAEWKIIRASDLGAPHRRARLYLVAYPSGEGLQGCKQVQPRIFKPDGSALPEPRFDIFGEWSDLATIIGRLRPSYGLSARMVGRGIKGLGNSVIPQIPEWIASQILKYEEENESR